MWNCPHCKKPLSVLDDYRLFCKECSIAFTTFIPCPRCKASFLQITARNKFSCTHPACPSRATDPPSYFFVEDFSPYSPDLFLPYTELPPKEPKSDLAIERINLGPFTVYKVWGLEMELDIVIEPSEPFKTSLDFTWHWDPENLTMSIQSELDQYPFREKIVLEELQGEKITDIRTKEISGRGYVKTERLRYLIITLTINLS